MRATTRRNGFRTAWLVATAAVAISAATLSPLAGRGGDGSQGRANAPVSAGRPITVLFLGQDADQPHAPSAMFPLIAPKLARRGIQLTYVSTPAAALSAEKLSFYDAILIYGDHQTITPDQEKALLEFVEQGKGLIAIHSASGMFPASGKYVALVGGQSQRPGTGGEFTGTIVQPAHPAVAGVQPFATWDEPIGHTTPNTANRTVLMERVDGQTREPLTWVRTEGRGRVFYTAYGHDQRTWSTPGFQQLIQQAIVWGVDDATRQTWQQLKMPEVVYADGFNVPNYENRDPAPKFQLPFTPQDSMKFIQTPAEFSVELFASEPDIVKPITFSFDERGRLWVIETVDYPNEMLNGLPGDDRIKILEDTDGDGRADKITVFAEHLNIPTSLTFANDGVIVAQAPNFLFLKDTDGDGKADVRQVLSSGWGTRDTHAEPSNLQYGIDNYVWGVVGYSGYNGEMNGKPMQFTQGPYRFKSDGSAFEYMTTSTNNTWGLGFSENFDVFGSTANNDPSWYMAIPNRYFDEIQGLPGGGRASGPGYQSLATFYALHAATPYIRQVDVQGGYTAAAGHYLYTARAFPKEYWNRIAFINEPTAHLVGQGIVEPQGSGYATRDGWNLMSGAEEWIAPVHSQVGPDGAVWVSDWYNFIAQHNPTPVGFSVGKGAAYETSLRDHSRGRIYRIVYKKAPSSPKRSLSKSDPAGLISALAADNMFWRLQAQRLIVERGQKDVVPQLLALVRNRTVDEIGTNGGALHALWTLHGLGEVRIGTDAYRAATEALKHPAAGVRKAAAMVLPHTAEAASAVVGAGLLRDPDLHTRLGATLVLADSPMGTDVVQAVYTASQQPENYGDRWLSRALYIAASRHQEGFLSAYRADRNAVSFKDLPIALRLGATKPDWRTPPAPDIASDWKDMQVPGNWEARGLPDFDGVVWFTRTVEWPAGMASTALSLGRISNMAEVWMNGISLALAPPAGSPAGPPTGAPGAAPAGGRAGAGVGRGNAGPPLYALPAGTLRPGHNTLTVRIQNNRNDGGFLGTPDSMFVEAGDNHTPLAGTWKYRVERQTNAGGMYTKPGQLAAHVAFTAAGGPAGAAAGALPAIVQAPDVVLRLGVVPNQMKFDITEFTVGPGQLVEIVFTNPDVMQHNFVLGASGSLEQLGAAADQLAKSPTAQALQYVPESSLVLASTKLLDPGQTLTLQFRAPAQPGQYPYVCTFPTHWRVMNGVLNVVQGGGGRGRGGRGAGQP